MQPGQSTGCPFSFSSSFLLPRPPLLSFSSSVSVSHSESFSPSPPCSDCYSDTAYPAVISLITFKQLSVAFSPSLALPLHSLPSNCMLFSPPVSRRKRFSLSNNKRQILIQCIHFLLQRDFIHVGLIWLEDAEQHAPMPTQIHPKRCKYGITYVHNYVEHCLFIILSVQTT